MLFGKETEILKLRSAQLVALLAVVGVNASEGAELPSAESLTAALAGKQKTAVDAALAPVTAQLAAANDTVSAFSAGLSAAGVKVGEIKPGDLKAKEGAKAGELVPAAAAIQSAVQTAVAAQAAKQIAASGHQGALDIPSGGSGSSSNAGAEGEPENQADFKTKLGAIKDPGERTTYFRKHKAKFGL